MNKLENLKFPAIIPAFDSQYLNTSVNGIILVQPTSNYYSIVFDNSTVSTGDILHFNIYGLLVCDNQ